MADSPEVEDFTASVGVVVPRPLCDKSLGQMHNVTMTLSIFGTRVDLAMGYDFFPEEQGCRISGFTSVFRCLIEGYQDTLWITLLNDSGTPLNVHPPHILVSQTLARLVSLLGYTVVIRTLNDISVKRLVQSDSPQNRLQFFPRPPSLLIRVPHGGSNIPPKTEEFASNTEHYKVDSSLDQAEGIISKDPEELAQGEPPTNRDVKRESPSPLTLKLAQL
jgi:hypothetical protein